MKLILLTVAFALALLQTSPASACKCDMDGKFEDAAAPAAAVFAGKVLSIRRTGNTDVIQFRVTASWKGDVAKIVNVYSGNTSCGLGGAVVRGRRYIVFASHRGKRLLGEQCGRRAFSEADAERLTATLGTPRVP